MDRAFMATAFRGNTTDPNIRKSKAVIRVYQLGRFSADQDLQAVAWVDVPDGRDHFLGLLGVPVQPSYDRDPGEVTGGEPRGQRIKRLRR